MPNAKAVVLSNPVEGREDEFNKWYAETHLDEMLTIPGIVGAQRYRLAASKGKWRYLAIYEIEAADAKAPVTEMRRRLKDGEMVLHESMDQDGYSGAFEPI